MTSSPRKAAVLALVGLFLLLLTLYGTTAALTDNLLAYYDGKGSTCETDQTGNANLTKQGNAACINTSLNTTGFNIVTNASEFWNATIPNLPNGSIDRSFCLWQNITTYMSAASTGTAAGWGTDASCSAYYLGESNNGANAWRQSFYGNGVCDADVRTFSTSSEGTNGNTFWCMVWDGTTNKLYVNGTNVVNDTDVINTRNSSFQVGQPHFSALGSQWVTGIGIWRRAITQAEITTLFNGGSLCDYATCVNSGDTTPPSISGVVNWSISNASAIINSTASEVSNMTVGYGTTVNLGTTSVNVSTTVNLSITLTGLTNSTLYYYNVTRTDASGNSNTTGPYNFTTSATADTVSPRVTNVINWSISNASAIINSTSDELANMTVRYGTTITLGTTVVNTSTTVNLSSALTGLLPGTLYYYNVTRTDTTGNSNTTSS